MAISNDWARQRSFLRRTYNLEVREYFRDVSDADIAAGTTSRSAVLNACMIDAKDSRVEAYMKMHTFRYVVQKVHLKPDVFGIPITDLEEHVNFSPTIHLYFEQDAQAVPAGKDVIRRQISFRLVGESHESITPTKAERLATKIKNEFAVNNGYRFDTVKIKTTYQYHPKLPKMSTLVQRESDGREIMRKVLSIIDLSYDENNIGFNTPQKESVTNPVGTDLIYGKRREKSRWRPIAVVRFQYASMSIDGLHRGQVLVDRSYRFAKVLERA